MNAKLLKMRDELLRRVFTAMDTDPSTEVVMVLRVKDDKGSVFVDGAGRGFDNNRGACPFCGQLGHVYYPGSQIVAEMRHTNHATGRLGKWYVNASRGNGDAIVECAWCGASTLQCEFWGLDEERQRIKQFRKDFPKKHGYRVRIEVPK